MRVGLTTLPLEIISDILAFLDLVSLLQASQTSKLLAAVCRDEHLNPWTSRLKTVLRDQEAVNEGEQELLNHLGCYSSIPRQNWLLILSLASPEKLLFNDIPWLPDELWHRAFMMRFLPSWTRWKRTHSWKRAFLSSVHCYYFECGTDGIPHRLIWRINHRLNVTCTAEESWTSYLILSRQGIVNLNAASSRQFNPHAVLNIYKFVSSYSPSLLLTIFLDFFTTMLWTSHLFLENSSDSETSCPVSKLMRLQGVHNAPRKLMHSQLSA